MNVFRE
jgi:uncharacterized membrane protein YeaQ/YmgE (transglycosylase-associated protein family)